MERTLTLELTLNRNSADDPLCAILRMATRRRKVMERVICGSDADVSHSPNVVE